VIGCIAYDKFQWRLAFRTIDLLLWNRWVSMYEGYIVCQNCCHRTGVTYSYLLTYTNSEHPTIERNFSKKIFIMFLALLKLLKSS